MLRIGDCVEPRVIAEAVFDGHRLGREIDTPDPATPLPFIREQRILGWREEDYDGVLRHVLPLDAGVPYVAPMTLIRYEQNRKD